MTNTNRAIDAAYDLALRTADAYSFPYYGSKRWYDCAALLLARGYNRIEAEAILRSVFTRYAYDGRQKARAKGTAADLAELLDNRCGGDAQRQHYIDEIVLETMMPTVEVLPSRAACRLVWSR